MEEHKYELALWLSKKTDNNFTYFDFVEVIMHDILNFLDSNNLKVNVEEDTLKMRLIQFLLKYSIA